MRNSRMLLACLPLVLATLVAPEVAAQTHSLAEKNSAYRAPTGLSRADASVAQAVDLCAPCTNSSQCVSSLCAIALDATEGYCTQACTQAGACPQNFSCATSSEGVKLCIQDDVSVCPSPYLAPKNAICNNPSTTDDPNAGISRTCAAGLTCYGFPTDSSGNYVGVCVTKCSSTDASAACAAEETCCFGTGTDTSCQKKSTAQVSVGGCFVVGEVGSSCAEPDHSYCVPGALCEYTQVAAAASCYGSCGTGSCPTGGYCLTLNNAPVCCDARTLNLQDVTTCQPLQGICRREVGVTCSVNADCRLGLCQKNGTQAACSTDCTTSADCPGSDQDVNGDGVADGGSSCLTFGSSRRCWPLEGPAKAPACATAVPASVAVPKQGCQCSGGGGADFLFLAPLALLLAGGARRRRRRRRGTTLA